MWPADCIEREVPKLTCIPAVFKNLVDWALILAGVVAVFLIIVSGYKFISSGGDPKQVEGARQTLTYAIIGLLVVFLSFFIINIIAGVTGVECIKIFNFDSCK